MPMFGNEEESLFLKPATLQPANVGDEVHAELLGRSMVALNRHPLICSQRCWAAIVPTAICRSTPACG